MNLNAKLKKAWSSMYSLTRPECNSCRLPRSCCSREYCLEAIRYALAEWGVTLRRTDNSKLPLMGPSGCIADPWLRPFCTLHVCSMNSFGTLGSPEKDSEYFSLRERIDRLETKRRENRKKKDLAPVAEKEVAVVEKPTKTRTWIKL